MTVEDRLRATTRAIDDTVPGPSAEPAAVAGVLAVGKPRSRGERRWPGWLVPLVAAVAVTVIAATLVGIRDISGTMTKHIGHPAANPSPTPSGPVTDPEALPMYFVALRFPSDGVVAGQ